VGHVGTDSVWHSSELCRICVARHGMACAAAVAGCTWLSTPWRVLPPAGADRWRHASSDGDAPLVHLGSAGAEEWGRWCGQRDADRAVTVAGQTL
jgi:hypothetical protein